MDAAGGIVTEVQSSAEYVHLLAGISLFAATPKPLLEQFAKDAETLTVPPRAVFVNEGDPPALFLVCKGIIRSFYEEGERKVTVKHFIESAFFGEKEALGNLGMLASSEAITPSVVVRIPAANLRPLLESDPKVCFALLEDVCGRFSVAVRNERAVIFSDIEKRLAGLLVSLAEIFGETMSPGTIRIHTELSHTELANSLGVVKRSVLRAWGRWQTLGWVSRRKGWYLIHNMEELQSLARGVEDHLNYQLKSS